MKNNRIIVNHEELENTPYLAEQIFDKLPELLKESCSLFKYNRERDIHLLSSISVLSGLFPNMEGTFSQKTVYPNLFFAAIAPPASGKGVLSYAQVLGMKIHKKYERDNRICWNKYEAKVVEYKNQLNANKKKATGQQMDISKPKEPQRKVLFIPANSSSAALIKMLKDSGGKGIVVDSEIDTVSSVFKQDWGGYSEILRKAFHHEPISYSRKIGNELIEIDLPKISIAFSGTLSQISGIFPSAENGLFSRFMNYIFASPPEWHNVSPKNSQNLNDRFDELSERVCDLVERTKNLPLTFKFTGGQIDSLNEQFTVWLKEIYALYGDDGSSVIKRLALIVFRICMVLSILREAENELIDDDLVCSDSDFKIAMSLATVLKDHSMVVLNLLPKSEFDDLSGERKKFFDLLPETVAFQRKKAVEIGKNKMSLSDRTVSKYLKIFLDLGLLKCPKYGFYAKV